MAGVLLLLGDEEFLARKAAEEAMRARPDLEWSRLAGVETSAARLLDEARTPTLLGGPRGLYVEEAEPLLEGASLEAIARYAGRPAPGALLILRARRIDARFKASKALLAAAEVRECRPPKEAEVGAWIARRGGELGLRVARDAADALRSRIGDDLGLLDAALERLRLQIAPRTALRAEDVIESTEEQRSPVLFEASNALEARDLPAALRSLRACFEEGVRTKEETVTDPQGVALILLGLLHGSYAKLIRFHIGRAEGAGEEAAAQAAGVSPNAARYFVERARRHRLETLLDRHDRFLEADLALKGGDGDAGGPRATLEWLLVSLLR